jgi:hypothetical protein
MSYELAKQLWDAGYPFKRRGDAVQFMCACTKDVCEGPSGREFRFEGNLYPDPTLSELIEACGDRFGLLETMHPYRKTSIVAWDAWSYEVGDDITPDYKTEGSIPEEAIAKLWLALHTSTSAVDNR